MDLIHGPKWLAAIAHTGQVRKYTGEPYINHPKAVAETIWENLHGKIPSWDLEALWAAAWLHDVVEDTMFSIGDIRALIHSDLVCNLVLEVTDISSPSDGGRAVRKAIDRKHLSMASPYGQTLKCADIIDNTKNIVDRDLKFAHIYIPEMKELLTALTKAEEGLFQKAYQTVYGAKIDG